MLEQGISTLLQSDPVVKAIATNGGGFYAALPKDELATAGAPTWSYLFLGGGTEHTLQSERGPRMRRLQIDCYGVRNGNGSDAILLSMAIDEILDGFSGILPDPDNTGVNSCLAEGEPMDFPLDEYNRTFRRMTEYMISY